MLSKPSKLLFAFNLQESALHFQFSSTNSATRSGPSPDTAHLATYFQEIRSPYKYSGGLFSSSAQIRICTKNYGLLKITAKLNHLLNFLIKALGLFCCKEIVVLQSFYFVYHGMGSLSQRADYFVLLLEMANVIILGI